MAILNPEHLFEQADRLATPPAGAPTQVDLRRAISNAYYGVFHAIVTAVADRFIGVSKRASREYALAYRSVDHQTIRDICRAVQKPVLAKYAAYAPDEGFESNIRAFAAAMLQLQELRLMADYDPSVCVHRTGALLSVAMARTAVRRFQGASTGHRTAFLTLLVFPPR